jgi:hypothetical protein
MSFVLCASPSLSPHVTHVWELGKTKLFYFVRKLNNDVIKIIFFRNLCNRIKYIYNAKQFLSNLREWKIWKIL